MLMPWDGGGTLLPPSSPGLLLLPLSLAKDWKPPPLQGVLAAATTTAFDSDPEISDVDEDEPGGLVGTQADVVSPGGHSDAQTLALMLQEQLDAINQEIRWDGVKAVRKDGPFVSHHGRSVGTRQRFGLILTPEGQGYR